MYTCYVAALVWLALTIMIHRHRKEFEDGQSDATIAHILNTLFCGILMTVVGLVLDRWVPTIDVDSPTYTLVSMKSASSVSGTFVLGSGTLQGQMFYTVYVRNKDGSKSPCTIPALPRVRIYEDSPDPNTGTWVSTTRISKPNNFLAHWAFDPDQETDVGDVLHVPKGTVVNNFSVN